MFKVVKPLRVSPAIKTTRWILLICGIFYGSWKLERYRALEDSLREMRANQRREEHENAVREGIRRTKEDIIGLGRELGVEVPPDIEL